MKDEIQNDTGSDNHGQEEQSAEKQAPAKFLVEYQCQYEADDDNDGQRIENSPYSFLQNA